MTFAEIIAKAQTRGKWTTVDRLENFKTQAESVIAVPGVFVELGVAKGCSATVLAHLAQQQNRRLFLLDNFEGLPAPGPEDGPNMSHLKGHCKGDFEDVRDFLHETVPGVQVDFLIGDFEQTAPQLAERLVSERFGIAMLHLDGDWYRSTKVALESIGLLVSPGGVILIDDYGWGAGCRKAVDEWLAARRIHPKINRVGPYQAWFVMP